MWVSATRVERMSAYEFTYQSRDLCSRMQGRGTQYRLAIVAFFFQWKEARRGVTHFARHTGCMKLPAGGRCVSNEASSEIRLEYQCEHILGLAAGRPARMLPELTLSPPNNG